MGSAKHQGRSEQAVASVVKLRYPGKAPNPMDQVSFGDAEYAAKKKTTRREVFLAELDKVVPWAPLLKVIEPFHPVAGQTGGRVKQGVRVDFANALALPIRHQTRLRTAKAHWSRLQECTLTPVSARRTRKGLRAKKVRSDPSFILAGQHCEGGILSSEVALATARFIEARPRDTLPSGRSTHACGTSARLRGDR